MDDDAGRLSLIQRSFEDAEIRPDRTGTHQHAPAALIVNVLLMSGIELVTSDRSEMSTLAADAGSYPRVLPDGAAGDAGASLHA